MGGGFFFFTTYFRGGMVFRLHDTLEFRLVVFNVILFYTSVRCKCSIPVRHTIIFVEETCRNRTSKLP